MALSAHREEIEKWQRELAAKKYKQERKQREDRDRQAAASRKAAAEARAIMRRR